MAVDMFIKLGDIKGEAQDGTHKDEIDVLAWSWGASNSGNAHMGGGAGAGKVNVQDLSITKYIDKSTPLILQACAKGTHLKNVVLTVRKAGDKPLEYLQINLDEVLISSYSTGGSGGEDRLTENVTLNFATYKIVYKEQLKTGGAGSPVQHGWNIPKNVPL